MDAIAEDSRLDATLPCQVLTHVFSFLPPSGVGRCICVNARWRSIASSEALWRRLCRSAIDRYHPRPTLPTATPLHEEGVSLSLAHQQVLSTQQASDARALGEAQRRVERRAEVVAALRARASSSGGFLRAFPDIPMVRTAGVYSLRHEYTRKGVRDMFHVYEGILRVIYHRTFLFRPDGTLLYSMLPGDYTESFKDFRRTLAAEVAGAAEGTARAGDGRNVGESVSIASQAADSGGGSLSRTPALFGAASGGESAFVRGERGGRAAHSTAGGVSATPSAAAAAPVSTGGVTPGMGSVGPRTSEAARGTWRLEGDLLVIHVRCAHNVSLLWRCRIRSEGCVIHSRLCVESLYLVEGTAAAESSTLMTQVVDEEFVWRPAAPIAALSGTARGAVFF